MLLQKSFVLPLWKVLPMHGKEMLQISPEKRCCVLTAVPLGTCDLLLSSFLLSFRPQGMSQALASHRGSDHSNHFSY